MAARVIEVPWPKPGSGGMTLVQASIGRDETVAFHFRTPATVDGRNGSISLFEHPGPPCHYDGALSTVIGDMSGNTSPVEAFNDDPAPYCDFHGNDARKGKGDKARGPLLQPSADYYLNVRPENPQAGVSTFSVQVSFVKPRH